MPDFLQPLYDTFAAQPWLYVSCCVVLGLLVGSFLNVVIHRMPIMLENEARKDCEEMTNPGVEPQPRPAYNLVVPRSACPACGHRITALQNVPLLSWLALRGKCAACGARISARYPVVELAAGLIGAYAAWRYGPTLQALGAMAFGWSLLALAAIDLDTQLLPDDITLPLLWSGLLLNVWGTFVPLSTAVLGAVAGYLALWLVYWGFKLATGKDGMGFGDFKLLAAIGAWLGWQKLPLVILLSSVVGAAVGIALIVLARHGREKPIPFGPYLAAAGLIALFWGELITRRWLPILG
jgi:leader peptidase (prepilin peptidase)/N-methyltransferase